MPWKGRKCSVKEIGAELIGVQNDNDGTGDQHNPLFSGTVDWSKLAKILSESEYTKCVSMEVTIGDSGIEDEAAFLDHVFETGTRFARMIVK